MAECLLVERGTVQSAHARPGRLSASAAIVLIPGAYRQTAACSPGVPAGRPGAGSGARATVRFRVLCQEGSRREERFVKIVSIRLVPATFRDGFMAWRVLTSTATSVVQPGHSSSQMNAPKVGAPLSHGPMVPCGQWRCQAAGTKGTAVHKVCGQRGWWLKPPAFLLPSNTVCYSFDG
jgi:hypothetical protein